MVQVLVCSHGLMGTSLSSRKKNIVNICYTLMDFVCVSITICPEEETSVTVRSLVLSPMESLPQNIGLA